MLEDNSCLNSPLIQRLVDITRPKIMNREGRLKGITAPCGIDRVRNRDRTLRKEATLMQGDTSPGAQGYNDKPTHIYR